MASVQVFLSTVSKEFRSYRDALRHDLDRPDVTVKVQEDFIATGTETLDKLDDYIVHCDAVIHLVGDMTGAAAEEPSVAAIRKRYPDLAERVPVLQDFLRPGAPLLSYTQWEAWLTIYHGKPLVIAVPQDGAPRDESYQRIEAEREAQQAHLKRLAAVERYPEIHFSSADRLAVEMLRSRLYDIVGRAADAAPAPIHLPYRSLGALYVGRQALMAALEDSLGPAPRTASAEAVATVLCGMSGVGKTRAALEFAWRRTTAQSAVFFVGASSPQALNSNLAALCRQSILDLPDQHEAEEPRQVEAVLRWLRLHPGWLLILDNIDSEDDARSVEALLTELRGGQAIVTSLVSNWSGNLVSHRVDVLPAEAARQFLLARTDGKRRPHADDEAVAATLADELGGLPLALEQAGAYVSTQRMTLPQYLAAWQGQRERVLAWFDPRLMSCDRSVAMTWQTSFDQLSPAASRLLHRLAWLSPSPIPESLLDVAVANGDGEGEGKADAFGALVELDGHSLVARAADAPTFSVHRLVQEVTRLSAGSEPARKNLEGALRWLDAAFVGDVTDPRIWPDLIPLVPHARAVGLRAAQTGIPLPTAGLLLRAGRLQANRALYAEAEALERLALELTETSRGTDHPDVASVLVRLGGLLLQTNRAAEAESLLQRALAIDEARLGHDHPDVARDLSAWSRLLCHLQRLEEAEAPLRRALAIVEARQGADHPDTADLLATLGGVLWRTGNDAEAERLVRRALAIHEAAYGSNHVTVAEDLHVLAQHVAPDEAEILLKRVLAIKEASLGPNHPDVAWSVNLLALHLGAAERYDEAEPLLRRALAIDEDVFGTDHPAVAFRLRSLALMIAFGAIKEQMRAAQPNTILSASPINTPMSRRRGEVESLYRRTLAISEASFGPDHPQVADDLAGLAHAIRNDPERRAEAESLLRRALPIREARFGPDHPQVLELRNEIAQLAAPADGSRSPADAGPDPFEAAPTVDPPGRDAWPHAFVAPAGEATGEASAWKALADEMLETLMRDVRQLQTRAAGALLLVDATLEGTRSPVMSLGVTDHRELFLLVNTDAKQSLELSEDDRRSLTEEMGLIALDSGNHGRFFGTQDGIDLHDVSLVMFRVLGAFGLPAGPIGVSWLVVDAPGSGAT